MSNNQLNDISKVYLSQVAEETPGERIDRKSQEGVAKRKAAAASEKEDRVKKAGEFQKHKQSILAKGGRHVDALDSWHKKQAYERNAKTRSEALMSSEELKEKEIYKGKHGQSEKEYQAGRSDAGKRISGDEKHGPASYTRRGVKQQEPTKPGEKPEHTPKLGSAEKNELAYRKSRLLKKEALSDWRTDLSDIIEAGPLTASPSLSQDGVMRDNQNLDQVPAKKKRMTQTEFEKKVDEKNVKNKVIINPTFQESIREIGGEVLEAVETEVDEYLETVSKVKRAENVADKERWAVDEAVKGEDTQRRKDASAERRSGEVGGVKTPKRRSPSKGRGYVTGTKASIDWWKDHNKKEDNVEEQANSGDKKDDKKEDDPTLAAKEKRISQMKKMVLLKKMQAVRSGAGAEITASYDPEGEVIDETLTSLKAASFGMPHKERKELIDKYKKNELELKKGKQPVKAPIQKEETIIERPLTGYEDKKKEEVIKALKKKKPEFKKRYGKDAPDVMYAVAAKTAKKKGDTSKSDDRYAYEEIEFAVDYFYEQGINEDGLDLIIEEIGLDAFVEFVLNPSEELMEERSARKMNVRTKKKMPAIVASDAEAEAKRRAGKTGEYKETPKKKAKVGSPAYTTTVKSEPKKKEAPKPVAKPVVKKVEKAVVKVKPTQPKKEVSKGGLRDRISGAVSGAVKAGVKRHKKAVQPARVFGKGVASGVRSAVRFAGKAKKAVVGEEVECNCDCGKDPCVKCGEGHHKLGEEKKSVEKKKRETLEKITKDAKDILKQDEIHSKIEEASVSGQELKYCKRCKKPETRNDCAYGPEEWDRSAVNIEWGEETVYEATGRWVDSKGRSHKFSISTNTVVDHGYIKDLVKSRYPAKRIFIKTDKEKSKKKKDAKKVKKESFSNWREENLTEHGNKNKPGYVNIGMGIWVKKEDAEKKKAQLAKSVRGENIPGFKGGRLD